MCAWGFGSTTPSLSNVGDGGVGAVCARGAMLSRIGRCVRNSQTTSATPRAYDSGSARIASTAESKRTS